MQHVKHETLQYVCTFICMAIGIKVGIIDIEVSMSMVGIKVS